MLLAIDTSVGTSVAIVQRDGRVVIELGSDNAMRHAELLGSYFDEVRQYRNEIEAVVVGIGPGPFTGLRVGVAAAKLYALGSDRPLLPVVSHDAIAHRIAAECASPESPDHGIADRDIEVRTDARRREAFVSTYRVTATSVERVSGPMLQPADGREFSGPVSAAWLARVALQTQSSGGQFAAAEAIYLRSPDVTMSAANAPHLRQPEAGS